MAANIPGEVIAHINSQIAQNDGKDTTVSLNFGVKKFKIGTITPEIKKSIQQCKNLDYLELSDSGLTSLDNLPDLENLDTLDLRNNLLPDEEVKKIGKYKKLQNLYIENNRIQNIETLNHLGAVLEALNVLEIQNNPVVDIPNFNVQAWNAFKELDILNHADREGNKLDD